MKKLSLFKSLLVMSCFGLCLTACDKHEEKQKKEVQIQNNKDAIDPFEEVEEVDIDVVPVDQVQMKKADVSVKATDPTKTIEIKKQ